MSSSDGSPPILDGAASGDYAASVVEDEPGVDPTGSGTCCSADERRTCCAPADKAGCCGAPAEGRCGCR